MVICHRRLGLYLYVGSADAGQFGRGDVLLPGVLGKGVPYFVLKIRRFVLVDGKNRGKTQLADYLMHGGAVIMGPLSVRKQHGEDSFAIR